MEDFLAGELDEAPSVIRPILGDIINSQHRQESAPGNNDSNSNAINTSSNVVDAQNDQNPTSECAAGENNDSAPQAAASKRRRADMGPAEKAAVRLASAARADKLNSDISSFHDAEKELMEKIAEDNDITVERVKRLVFHTASMKKKKKASDHNVLVYVKSQEVNAGKPRLNHLSLPVY